MMGEEITNFETSSKRENHIIEPLKEHYE